MRNEDLTYDLAGYLTVLKMREVRTLLVEGVSDHRIVRALLHELQLAEIVPTRAVAVDYRAMIVDVELPPNVREAVEHMYAAAVEEGIELSAFVDREFREFTTDPDIGDDLGRHWRDGMLFWTRGHSIENYFASVEAIREVLQTWYAPHVTPDYLRRVEDAHDRLIHEAAAFSYGVWTAGVTDRSRHVAAASMWEAPPTGLRMREEAFADSLDERGVGAVARQLLQEKVQEGRGRLQTTPPEVKRWFMHGHIGSDVVWAGIAFLAKQEGLPGGAVESIERGFSEAKERLSARWWSKRCVTDAQSSPLELWQWLHEPPQEVA